MRRSSLDDGEFESLIERAVRHAMSVVSVSNNSDSESEQRNLIVTSCERVSSCVLIDN